MCNVYYGIVLYLSYERCTVKCLDTSLSAIRRYDVPMDEIHTGRDGDVGCCSNSVGTEVLDFIEVYSSTVAKHRHTRCATSSATLFGQPFH